MYIDKRFFCREGDIVVLNISSRLSCLSYYFDNNLGYLLMQNATLPKRFVEYVTGTNAHNYATVQ